MENGTIKMDIAQEFAHRKGRKQGGFEVALKDLGRMRFAVKVPP